MYLNFLASKSGRVKFLTNFKSGQNTVSFRPGLDVWQFLFVQPRTKHSLLLSNVEQKTVSYSPTLDERQLPFFKLLLSQRIKKKYIQRILTISLIILPLQKSEGRDLAHKRIYFGFFNSWEFPRCLEWLPLA